MLKSFIFSSTQQIVSLPNIRPTVSGYLDECIRVPVLIVFAIKSYQLGKTLFVLAHPSTHLTNVYTDEASIGQVHFG